MVISNKRWRLTERLSHPSLLEQDVTREQCFTVAMTDGAAIPFLQTALPIFYCLASPFVTIQTSVATKTQYKTPINPEMPLPCAK